MCIVKGLEPNPFAFMARPLRVECPGLACERGRAGEGEKLCSASGIEILAPIRQ